MDPFECPPDDACEYPGDSVAGVVRSDEVLTQFRDWCCFMHGIDLRDEVFCCSHHSTDRHLSVWNLFDEWQYWQEDPFLGMPEASE